MKKFEFRIDLSSDEYLDYYRGTAKLVLAQLPDGRTVRFPASLLKRYVTSGGIHGRFALTCDEDFKNADLKRLK